MPIQDTRNMALTTPLGKDKLLLERMTAREELGRPFELRIVALSDDHNIALNSLLGESVSVRLDTHGGEPRYFNGFVSRFSHLTTNSDRARYEIIAKPWLWYLTRNSDCRMFQEMTVPDIIKQVFRDRGFSDFEDRLKGSYRTWEYCVQYRETDFNFVSRLMEQEGMYYYFKHTENTHTLILSDSYSAHDTVSNYGTVPYFPRVDQQRRERDHVFDWNVYQQVQPGKYAIDDFDFKNPTSDLLVDKETARDHALSGFEIFDYPGEYVDKTDGKHYVQVRNEELHALYERADCAGNARGLAAGALFSLQDYPRADQNKEYLIVSALHEVVSDDYSVGGRGAEVPYHLDFTVMDAKQPYRAARTTPKPMVQGPQTAIVVGKGGEEIYCDEYGRVKLQFHWDRHGTSDENSSCWVRVAQVWAGAKWGAMHIPRMGQEVIVEFLEGDPDRPIITGRVYNAEKMPPYELPANQTISGLKSRSTKGGGADNFNEIYFEDKKGEEQLYIHAEKNQDIKVENDETHTVDHDRTKHIKHDEITTIGNDRTETVGNNETISIGVNRSEDVGKDETISIGENRSETVGKNETISIGVDRSETVGKNETISIGENRTEDVGKSETITIGENRTETIAKKETLSVGKEREQTIGKNDTLDVGKKLLVTAGDEITFKTGSASILMKKDGTITIKGKNITIQGSGKIDVKASAALGLKGSKISQN